MALRWWDAEKRRNTYFFLVFLASFLASVALLSAVWQPRERQALDAGFRSRSLAAGNGDYFRRARSPAPPLTPPPPPPPFSLSADATSVGDEFGDATATRLVRVDRFFGRNRTVSREGEGAVAVAPTRAVLWDARGGDGGALYDRVAALINKLSDAGVASFLYGGSVLGARRNHGRFSWDKDVDLAVFSTNTELLATVLQELAYPFYLRDDFGFHVDVMNSTYLDMWLFAEFTADSRNEKGDDREPGSPTETVSCVGVGQDGCARWWDAFVAKGSKPHYDAAWFAPPPRLLPFGPYLMPSPSPDDYLAFEYSHYSPSSTDLAKMCGKTALCHVCFDEEPFVFVTANATSGERVETLKIGDEVLQEFAVDLSGKYALRKAPSITWARRAKMVCDWTFKPQ